MRRFMFVRCMVSFETVTYVQGQFSRTGNRIVSCRGVNSNFILFILFSVRACPRTWNWNFRTCASKSTIFPCQTSCKCVHSLLDDRRNESSESSVDNFDQLFGREWNILGKVIFFFPLNSENIEFVVLKRNTKEKENRIEIAMPEKNSEKRKSWGTMVAFRVIEFLSKKREVFNETFFLRNGGGRYMNV